MIYEEAVLDHKDEKIGPAQGPGVPSRSHVIYL